MSKIKTLSKLLLHPHGLMVASYNNLVHTGIFNNMPDKPFLEMTYFVNHLKRLNLDSPVTFTEKIQWLKLYDRKPEYTEMVDKAMAKDYVAKIIGEEYIIPTIGVWDRTEDIDWEALPVQFVLKSTQGGGGNDVIICKDKNLFDRESAIRKLRKSLKSDIYWILREWPYKNVSKRIIAEWYIDSGNSEDLLDYKFFCFDGEVKFFKVDFGRFTSHHANYYTPDCELLPFGEQGLLPEPEHKIEMPDNLKQMIDLAERLSSGHTFLRVDLYNVMGKIYFGELTFYPGSGMLPFVPREWDERIGALIKLQ